MSTWSFPVIAGSVWTMMMAASRESSTPHHLGRGTGGGTGGQGYGFMMSEELALIQRSLYRSATVYNPATQYSLCVH